MVSVQPVEIEHVGEVLVSTCDVSYLCIMSSKYQVISTDDNHDSTCDGSKKRRCQVFFLLGNLLCINGLYSEYVTLSLGWDLY